MMALILGSELEKPFISEVAKSGRLSQSSQWIVVCCIIWRQLDAEAVSSRSTGGRSSLHLSGEPLVILLLGHDADGRLHVIVTGPTKLAARKLEVARALNFEPDPGDRAPGNGILIEPERMGRRRNG